MTAPTTYKDSGVDIDAADKLVDDISILAKSTLRPEVSSSIGGFAGLFAVPQGYKKPVLVACTDGVGTKLKLAIDLKHYDGLGQDLVAMCVNDLVCCGAEPLFFLDYFATGKLNTEQCRQVIASMSRCLKDIRCALLGGETAEMPGLYSKGDFDIAGFAVGVVEEDKIISGQKVNVGDHIIGLASAGPHSNGYSLVRKIIKKNHLDLHAKHSFAPEGLGMALLAPTTIYINSVLKLVRQVDVLALAHITGGGLIENLPRVFPESLCAVLEKNKIAVPDIFRFLKKMGNVPEDEMWRVFNMGIGFCVIVRPEDSQKAVEFLNQRGLLATVIGIMKKRIRREAPQVDII